MKQVRIFLVNRHGHSVDLGLHDRGKIYDNFGMETRKRIENGLRVMEENPRVPRVRVLFAGTPAAFRNPGNRSCYILERPELGDV